jgi:hypothetical protein
VPGRQQQGWPGRASRQRAPDTAAAPRGRPTRSRSGSRAAGVGVGWGARENASRRPAAVAAVMIINHLASFKIAGARTSTRKERNRGERERENYRAGAARGRRAARTCPARSRWECLRGKCYVSDRPLGRAEPVSVPVRLAPENF